MRPGLFCPQRYCSALKGAIFVIMPYCALCWALFLCHFAFLSLHTPGHPCAHLPVFLLVALVAYRNVQESTKDMQKTTIGHKGH